MPRKKKRQRAPGAGRKPGITDKPRTAILSIRVSVDRKTKFNAKIAKNERRAWLEGLIDNLSG